MILSAEHIIFSKKTLLFMHLMHRHKYMFFKNEIKPDKKNIKYYKCIYTIRYSNVSLNLKSENTREGVYMLNNRFGLYAKS